jgi:hypothetical protein
MPEYLHRRLSRQIYPAASYEPSRPFERAKSLLNAQVLPEHLDVNGRPLTRGVEIGNWYGKFGFFLTRHVVVSLSKMRVAA